ncbi:hypothetical protein AVEN_93456-1 [Araneus ventricosus]|uniref:Uncharacterized protein n=1 Tax=Araneus ventricosus TaxID=182803 RepID=A0A4Y2AP45_ARAVE|nr:hypothetical protein AVEN_93456-1 [Araneus ventricosus]
MTLYLTNIPETRSTGITKRTALAQICKTSRQQIANNNSNSTNNSAQRLTAEQLAMRKQDSKEIQDVQAHSPVSAPPDIYTSSDKM